MMNTNDILIAIMQDLTVLENMPESERSDCRVYYCAHLQALYDVLRGDTPEELRDRMERFVCRP